MRSSDRLPQARVNRSDDDRRVFKIITPVQPVHGWGPVLGASDHAEGMVVARLDALNKARLINGLPPNVNFAIGHGLA